MFACAPLMARMQPLVLVLTTSRGAEVVGLPTAGAFIRGLHLPQWPIGHGSLDVGGTGRGEGLYATDVDRYPEGTAYDVLDEFVAGADRMIDYLTDPARWTDGDGVMDVDGRWMTWTSVQLGFDMLRTIAGDWGHPSMMWTALNALGVLLA